VGFVDGKPLVDIRPRGERLAASTDLSDQISKDLKKTWVSFRGHDDYLRVSAAVGVVNDHRRDCFLAPKARKASTTVVREKKRAMEPA